MTNAVFVQLYAYIGAHSNRSYTTPHMIPHNVVWQGSQKFVQPEHNYQNNNYVGDKDDNDNDGNDGDDELRRPNDGA